MAAELTGLLVFSMGEHGGLGLAQWRCGSRWSSWCGGGHGGHPNGHGAGGGPGGLPGGGLGVLVDMEVVLPVVPLGRISSATSLGRMRMPFTTFKIPAG